MTSPRPLYGLDHSGSNLAAIQGKRVPDDPTNQIARLCVVRGIRTHDGFAQELHGHLPEYTRALNARAIMSNRVPNMKSPLASRNPSPTDSPRPTRAIPWERPIAVPGRARMCCRRLHLTLPRIRSTAGCGYCRGSARQSDVRASNL